jgi:hypothetical protein
MQNNGISTVVTTKPVQLRANDTDMLDLPITPTLPREPEQAPAAARAALPAAGPTVVVQWNEVALEAIRVTHPGPPIVARTLAILHTCMFDAWAAYDPKAKGTRLGSSLRRPKSEHTIANKTEAVSYAAYRALVDLVPSEQSHFADLLSALGYDPNDASVDKSKARGIGNVAAQAVLGFRYHDGANQLGDLHPGAYTDYTGYTPVNDPDHIHDPNRWQPLRVDDGHGGTTVQTYIAPFWGKVKPFALRRQDQFRPAEGPAHHPDPAYREQALEVIAYSASLTDEQKVIAEYWADGPASELPPGHWCLFGHFVSQRDLHDLDADVKMFFAIANAILDASIVSWEAKRVFDSVRPVTAIHYLFTGQMIRAWAGAGLGTQEIPGETWRPYQAITVVTPPFPEYISGHSIFSAAGAEILKRFTGSDVFGASVTLPAGMSRVEPGLVPAHDLTLSWATFTDAADQAGISRRYGGIHFVDGDLVARKLGRKVGAQAWKKAQSYIKG